MLKNIYKIFFVIIIICICFFSGILGYNLYNPINKTEAQNISSQNIETQNIETQNASINILKEDKEVSNTSVAKITPSTKMTYEYFYKEDQITEVVEDVPPYFLIDLTRQDLEDNFAEWEIKSFSNKEVVLQRVLEGESLQHYIIGDYDGFIAVYYKKEINGTNLKEITDIPIESLSEYEQNRIKEGIEITGEDQLIRFLESYGS